MSQCKQPRKQPMIRKPPMNDWSDLCCTTKEGMTEVSYAAFTLSGVSGSSPQALSCCPVISDWPYPDPGCLNVTLVPRSSPPCNIFCFVSCPKTWKGKEKRNNYPSIIKRVALNGEHVPHPTSSCCHGWCWELQGAGKSWRGRKSAERQKRRWISLSLHLGTDQ